MAAESSENETESVTLTAANVVPKWTVLTSKGVFVRKSRNTRKNRRGRRLATERKKRNWNSTAKSQKTQIIRHIIDDLWIVVFHFLDVQSFVSIQHICKHFHALFHSKIYSTNKYWQLQSNRLCCGIDSNYSTTEWFDFYVQLRRVIENELKFSGFDIHTNTPITDLACLNAPMFTACKYDCPLIFDLVFSQNTNSSINSPIVKPELDASGSRYYVDPNHVEIPLNICCEYNSINMVRYLLNQDNIPVNDDQLINTDRSPFFIACTHGFYQLVRLLLSKCNLTKKSINSDPYAGYMNGLYQLLFYSGKQTVLSDTIYDESDNLNKHPGFLIVSSLIKNYNADINCFYYGRGTILHVCIHNYANCYASSPRLEDLDINENIYDEYDCIDHDINGKKRLKSYYLHVIKFLLTDNDCRAKIDINARGYQNATPLYVACQRNVPEIVQMLLKFQTNNNDTDENSIDSILDVDMCHNQYGWSPLIVCAANGFVECLRLLLNYGQCRLFLQCQCSRSELVGGDMTALMMAAVSGNYNIIVEMYNDLVRNEGIKYSNQYIRQYVFATNSKGKTARQIAEIMMEKSQTYFSLDTRLERCHKTLSVLKTIENNMNK